MPRLPHLLYHLLNFGSQPHLPLCLSWDLPSKESQALSRTDPFIPCYFWEFRLRRMQSKPDDRESWIWREEQLLRTQSHLEQVCTVRTLLGGTEPRRTLSLAPSPWVTMWTKSDRKGHIMVKKMSLIMPPASFAVFAVDSGRSWEEGHQRVLMAPGCDSGYVVLHLCLLVRLLLFSV